MLKLYIGNKNYSSWSMRPWVLMTQAGIPFEEVMVRFDGFDAGSRFKAALAGAARSEPAGVLRVGTSPLLAETLVAGWLAEFAGAHPKLRIELDLSNTYVDLIEQRIDLRICFHDLTLPCCGSAMEVRSANVDRGCCFGRVCG